VIAFCETQDKAAQLEVEAALTEVAQPHMDEAKARKSDREYSFVIVTDDANGLANRIREMTNLPSGVDKGGINCAGCAMNKNGYCGRNLGQEAIPGSDGQCGPNNGPQCADCKAGPVVEAQGEEKQEKPQQLPRLVLLDIPDNGGYYVFPEGPITSETVQRFLDDHKNKNMERKQLC